MAHEGAPATSWVPYRKVIAQLAGNVLGFAVALAITKLGVHESAAVATEVSTVVGVVAGAVAGYIVKEGPLLLP